MSSSSSIASGSRSEINALLHAQLIASTREHYSSPKDSDPLQWNRKFEGASGVEVNLDTGVSVISVPSKGRHYYRRIELLDLQGLKNATGDRLTSVAKRITQKWVELLVQWESELTSSIPLFPEGKQSLAHFTGNSTIEILDVLPLSVGKYVIQHRDTRIEPRDYDKSVVVRGADGQIERTDGFFDFVKALIHASNSVFNAPCFEGRFAKK